jgi:Tfp pilus assembly protein PilN
MTPFAALRRRVGGQTSIGIGVSRGEVRFVGVNSAGMRVWNLSLVRGRADSSLAELIGKGLAQRPAMLRGRIRVACVVGPAEAQLRPLHGLPQLRSTTEQLAVVNESVDRFFVSEGSRMRVSSPVRARNGELWAAAIDGEVVNQVAEASRAHRVRLVGIAPIGATLSHLARRAATGHTDAASCDAYVRRADDGMRLHVVYDPAGMPVRLWRERASFVLPELEGDVRLPEGLDSYFADAYSATRLRARDPFVIGELSDEARRARLAQQRTRLWAGLVAASLVAAAWLPGALATRRADHTRARLATLAARQRELSKVEGSLAASTVALENIASFERSRRSATLFLAELAMTLPDSTAITTLHTDSLGGAMTLLAPRAAGALEAVSALPLVARVQMTGAVTREVTGGAELERASLRFVFQRRPVRRESTVRDSASRFAVVAPRGATASPSALPAAAVPGAPRVRVPERPVARGGSQ